MSTRDDTQEPFEAVTVTVTITRVSESTNPAAFRYGFEWGDDDLPPAVTATFREWLQERHGFDPVLEADVEKVPGLDELPAAAREHARRQE